MDKEKVINQIDVDIQRAEQTGEMLVCVGRKTAKDALFLLKEQEALLNKAYELLVDMEMDCFCDDLTCDDGWCDEHCTTNGPTPECIERWLRKQIEEGL